jgi:hypothetical protein
MGVGMYRKIGWVAAMIAALILSGCFEQVSQSATPGPTSSANHAPTILGLPPASIRVGESYDFTPSASDPDGDKLTFSISNKPSWASFDRTSGRLSGQPQDANAGIAANVRIKVSDGQASATLASFSITVNQIAMGSATLSWMPPTQNADGTLLTDLSGFKIYYGRSASGQDQMIKLTNPGLTRYVIENLSPATWYFSMSSINSEGIESARSGTASKMVG